MKTTATHARKQHREELRQLLYERSARGELGLVEAVKLMRKIADKTQAEYAKLVGVSPRVLIDFERGVGNPTLRSLERMLRPFAMELTIRRQLAPQHFRYNILDDTQAVFAQAGDFRAALEMARAEARKTNKHCWIRDGKRGGEVVASVAPDGRVGRLRGRAQ